MTDTSRYCIWRRRVSVGVRTVVRTRLEHFKHLRTMGVITHLPADLRGGKPAPAPAEYSGSSNRNNISFGWFRDHQGETHTVVNYGRNGY